jgi:hypothetical protein
MALAYNMGKKGAAAVERNGGVFVFIVCALVLAGVILTLPYTRDAARGAVAWIAGDADAETAVRALGERVSGGSGFLRIVGDAFAAALWSGDGAAPDAPGARMRAGENSVPYAALMFDSAVTASFAGSRSEYSDMLVPAGAPRGY